MDWTKITPSPSPIFHFKLPLLKPYTRGPWALALCLTTNLVGHGPKFQKLQMHSLSIPRRRNWPSFCSMGSDFRGNGWFSKLSYLGMKLACLAIGQNSRSGTYTLFPPGAQKTELIFTLRAEVSEILADFQNCHISAWIQEVAHILSFFSIERWAYFCSTGSGSWDTGQFSKLPYLGMKLVKCPKFQKLHIYPLSTPVGWNWAYFCSTGGGFQDTGPFSKLPYLGMKHGKWLKFQ